jgi:hypothetical protein
MADSPEVGRCQIGAVYGMTNGNERIFIKTVLTHSRNEPDNCSSGHSVEVHSVSPFQKDIPQQMIHNMSKEVLGVETPW